MALPDVNRSLTSVAGTGFTYTGNASQTENYTAHDYDPSLLLKTINFLDLYIVPVMVALGFFGNTISFLVFLFTHLRSLSSSVYLAALAVSDNGMLLCILASWGINVDFPISHMPFWCQTFVYLSYLFSFLSVWYVVAFTVERYIAVCFPFKRSAMCTTARARVVVAAIGACAAVMYTFAIWTTTSERFEDGKHFCHPRSEYTHQVVALNNVDTVITLIIPSVTIIVLNIRIAQQVVVFRGQRTEILTFRGSAGDGGAAQSGGAQGGGGVNSRSSSSISRHGGNNAQVTKMLLVVSTIFLLLNLPSHAFRIHGFVMQLARPEWRASYTYQDLQKLFMYVYYLNFCINLLLYSLCGQNFRAALRKLLLPEPCGGGGGGDQKAGGKLTRDTSCGRLHSCATTHMELNDPHQVAAAAAAAVAGSRVRSSGGGSMALQDRSRPLATPLVNWRNGRAVTSTPADQIQDGDALLMQ